MIIYAEVDLEMKAKALATCKIRGTVPLKHWKEDLSLMQFLQVIDEIMWLRRRPCALSPCKVALPSVRETPVHETPGGRAVEFAA
jgi:hypothetical protein